MCQARSLQLPLLNQLRPGAHPMNCTLQRTCATVLATLASTTPVRHLICGNGERGAGEKVDAS